MGFTGIGSELRGASERHWTLEAATLATEVKAITDWQDFIRGAIGANMSAKFKIDDRVRKIKGSEWQGKVVGTYSTGLTPRGLLRGE